MNLYQPKCFNFEHQVDNYQSYVYCKLVELFYQYKIVMLKIVQKMYS